jgi:HEAT repeat protein
VSVVIDLIMRIGLCVALGSLSSGIIAEERCEPDGTPERDARLVRLQAALFDEDPKKRLAAVAELEDVGEREPFHGLLTDALLDPHPSVREEAAYALGQIGNAEDLPLLAHALVDPDDGVREAAIVALTEFGGDEAARTLAVALSDEDVELREEALHALVEIGGDVAVVLVRQALADEEAAIRELAIEALEELAEED